MVLTFDFCKILSFGTLLSILCHRALLLSKGCSIVFFVVRDAAMMREKQKKAAEKKEAEGAAKK